MHFDNMRSTHTLIEAQQAHGGRITSPARPQADAKEKFRASLRGAMGTPVEMGPAQPRTGRTVPAAFQGTGAVEQKLRAQAEPAKGHGHHGIHGATQTADDDTPGVLPGVSGATGLVLPAAAPLGPGTSVEGGSTRP
jgi:hypothetical protein